MTKNNTNEKNDSVEKNNSIEKNELKKILQKLQIQDGDEIEFEFNEKKLKGTIIPGKEKNILNIKMNSGYNIGVNIEKIKNIKKIGDGKKLSKAKIKKIIQNEKLPKITLIHTGGTIASRVDYKSGGVTTNFEAEDLIAMYPELLEIANINTEMIGNMWSDDIRFENIEKIIIKIKEAHEKGAEGIIIGIGTDTLATVAAAITFGIEQCPIPIILVGAQRSSDRGSSDAPMNLISAAEFIVKTEFSGVGICMHENMSDENTVILPGTKTRKMHSSRRDAFKAINDTPIAKINFDTKKIEFIKKDYIKKNKQKEMIIKPNFEKKVALIKTYVGFQPEILKGIIDAKFKGIIFEGTGLGHLPIQSPEIEMQKNLEIKKEIEKILEYAIVGITTQTIYGRTHQHVYDKGIEQKEMGIIGCEDMHPETALVKLAWLLGNYDMKKAKELLNVNLRGEITKFSKIEGYNLP
ncbi:MAG: Glu-tRNA(Gln) amidotransferase subunit GatD [Patescibacteria group bacterium]|nr:Glu-tRNA(Gln) amidotransferase subunit GatD [Patescibacteria group bacterium]